jgi:hypothetical protein
MDESLRSVYWEAPEHNHIEKTNDWYWVVGIIGVAGSVASIIFSNVLFGVVILLAVMTVIITSHRQPRVIEFEVSVRGVRIEQDLYPYSTLDSFYIDEESPSGPQLIVKSRKLFVPLLILPIPKDYIDDIEDVIAPRIREEHLEEPLSHRLLEYFGF